MYGFSYFVDKEHDHVDRMGTYLEPVDKRDRIRYPNINPITRALAAPSYRNSSHALWANKMIKIYGIKNCETMKKAFAWLEAHGVAFEFIDYKKAGVAESHLPDWNRRAGWQALLNTRGLMWRKLNDEERADVDEAKALALLAKYPAMIRRPVLDTGKTLLVGFDAEVYAKELKR